jgi:DNA primase
MPRFRADKTPPPSPCAPRLQKLLGQLARFYRKRFNEEPRARQYLAERGLGDKQALEVFGAGYCDGTLRDVLPFDDQVLTDLRTLGVLKENGKELLRECVVFPLWSTTGACVGLYGRRLFHSEVKHLYLPGPRRGLVNWQAAKRAAAAEGELVLTESILDALSLYVAGVVNVVPCYGTGGFCQDHAELLRRFAPKRIAIGFDGDEPGRRAAAELSAKLTTAAKGATVRIIELPADTDPNSLLVQHGAEVLRRAVSAPPAVASPPASAPVSEFMPSSKLGPPSEAQVFPFAAAPASTPPVEAPAPVAGATKPAYEKTAHGFALHVDGRVYEVKASTRQGTQLRVTLKAHSAKDIDRFELATIDLFSHRSREWFSSLCASLFGIDNARATADLREVLAQLERTSAAGDKPAADRPCIELSDTEREEALALLRRPTLMQDILTAFEQLGYAEEICNKQLGYLVAISRKLDRPLSLLIESRSSAGKSALQDVILALVPDEDFLKYSRITDQALFYQAEDALEHKLLVIEEATGMGGAVYSVRALQSGEEMRVAATAKDPTTGKMRTEEYTVKAKTAVMMTTANPAFDEETKSRFICTAVNESAELTRKILEVQRQADTIEGIVLRRQADRVRRVHQNVQRLLRPVVVANPYAPKLTFPAQSIQARRDNKKYLGLIKAVTLLHQHQRETRRKTLFGDTFSYIESTLDDVAIANRIAREVLAARHGDVTPQGRKLFAEIRRMLLNGGGHEKEETAAFTRRRLREHTGWSDWQVKTHLGELVELEYLRVRQGATGKEYVYELSDTHLLEALPGFGLTEVEALGAVLGRATVTAAGRARTTPNLVAP